MPKRRVEYGRRTLRKGRGKNWHTHYRLSVEAGLVVSLAVLVWLIRAPLYPSTEAFEVTLAEQEVVEMEEIKQTKQEMRPPPPPRPPVPVEVPDDAILDDDELDLDVTLDLGEAAAYIPPPPAPVEEEDDAGEDMSEIFVVVEEMPEIIGGHNKIYEYLEYPTIARQAQMEGLVVVQVVVEPDGTGSNPVIAKSAGRVLDDAALEAVKNLRYKPGKQRGRAVRVKLAIPIRFLLKERS
ncbi:MAG: energy transducer TonB [Rhodothermales bacterium]|nr:energy transducer TonB [Rhodothermales bacterium]